MENNVNQNKKLRIHSYIYIYTILDYRCVFHSRCEYCMLASCRFTTNSTAIRSPYSCHLFPCEKLRLQASMVLNRGEYARDIYMHTHKYSTHPLTQKLQKQNHKTKLDMSGMDEKYRPENRAWKKMKKRNGKWKGGVGVRGELKLAKCYTDNSNDNNSRNEFPMAIGYMQTTHINIAQQNTNWKSFLHSKTFVKFPIMSTRDKRQSKLPSSPYRACYYCYCRCCCCCCYRRCHHRSKLIFKSM